TSFITFELDLEEMKWTCILAKMTQACSEFLDSEGDYRYVAFLLGRKIYSFARHGSDAVFDLDTGDFSRASYDESRNEIQLRTTTNLFSAGGSIFALQAAEELKVFRYDEQTCSWKKMHSSSNPNRGVGSYAAHAVIDTRIYFVGWQTEGIFGDDYKTQNIMQLSVLEIKPTLFELAAEVVLSCPEKKERARLILPMYLSRLLIRNKAADARIRTAPEPENSKDGSVDLDYYLYGSGPTRSITSIDSNFF
ncbi:hypothetical protein PFISCL1PPCAC_2783, partial [Pristionchus fissidentatus]